MLGVGPRGPLGRDVDDGAGGSSGAHRPADLDERDAWAVLGSVEGVGPVSFGRLIACFGSAQAVLAAARGRDAGRRLVAATADDGPPALAPEAAAALVEAAATPGRLLDPVRRAELLVLTLLDDTYPSRLRRIEL